MGWCSATEIFDDVCDVLLAEEPIDKVQVIARLIDALEQGDWDCQEESGYWDHPVVVQARNR